LKKYFFLYFSIFSNQTIVLLWRTNVVKLTSTFSSLVLGLDNKNVVIRHCVVLMGQQSGTDSRTDWRVSFLFLPHTDDVHPRTRLSR